MTITITINTGNAAFEDYGIEGETARILAKLARDIKHTCAIERALYDINGNKVGRVTTIGGDDWRDRGNNRQCAPYEGDDGEIVTPPEGQEHEPTCDACNPDTPGWIGSNKCRACNQAGALMKLLFPLMLAPGRAFREDNEQ